MTIRQQILDAIEARLKTIQTGVNVTVRDDSYTYQSQLGSNVFIDRQSAIQSREKPCLNIEAGAVTSDPERSEVGRPLRVFPVEIQIFGEGAPKDTVGKYLQDIVKCVGVDPTWGGLARWTEFDIGEVDTEQEDKTYFDASVDLEVTWRADNIYDI